MINRVIFYEVVFYRVVNRLIRLFILGKIIFVSFLFNRRIIFRNRKKNFLKS